MLGRLLADRAFAVVELIGSEGLDKLDIRPGCNELRLDIKDELTDVSIFRRSIKTLHSWRISETEPLPYASLYSELKKLGFITGMRQIVRSYTLRYGAGKAFDANGKPANRQASLFVPHLLTDHRVREYQRRAAKPDHAARRHTHLPPTLFFSACHRRYAGDRSRTGVSRRSDARGVSHEPID